MYQECLITRMSRHALLIRLIAILLLTIRKCLFTGFVIFSFQIDDQNLAGENIESFLFCRKPLFVFIRTIGRLLATTYASAMS